MTIRCGACRTHWHDDPNDLSARALACRMLGTCPGHLHSTCDKPATKIVTDTDDTWLLQYFCTPHARDYVLDHADRHLVVRPLNPDRPPAEV